MELSLIDHLNPFYLKTKMCHNILQKKRYAKYLGFQKDAKNWEEFKIEPITAEKEDIKVGNLLKQWLTIYVALLDTG